MFKIIAVVEKTMDGKAILSISRNKMCDCCGNIFCSSKKRHTLTIENIYGLQKGDKVELGLENKWAIIFPFLVFFIPSILFISILYINQKQKEWVDMFYGVSGIIIYFIVLRVTLLKWLEEKAICKVLRKLQ